MPQVILDQTLLSERPRAADFLWSLFYFFLLTVVSAFYWNGGSDSLIASRHLVFESHQYWRLWTSPLIHADPGHLLSNGLLFVILGTLIHFYFGSWIFPTLAFLSGGLIQALVLVTANPNMQLLGASGIVYWMGGFWLVMYFGLERTKSVFQRSLRACGVALLLFFPSEAFQPQVSYLAHFYGFVLGLSFGFVSYFINKNKFRSLETYRIEWDSFETPAFDPLRVEVPQNHSSI